MIDFGQLIDFGQSPLWVTLVKRIVTVLILSGFGLHAYVQYRRRSRLPAPERWVFFAFSGILLFAVVANFVSIVLATKLDIKQGPMNTGIFSFLLFMLYLVFAGGVARRVRY